MVRRQGLPACPVVDPLLAAVEAGMGAMEDMVGMEDMGDMADMGDMEHMEHMEDMEDTRTESMEGTLERSRG